MIELRELGQWHRLITPLIVPLFFWGATITAIMAGLFGFMGGLILLSDSPVFGIMVIAFTICVACVGVLAVRLMAEFCLVSFRINSNLQAIRSILERVEQTQLYVDQQERQFSQAA